MTRAILVVNMGSSSLKFALYEPQSLALRCRGTVSFTSDGGSLKLSGPDAALLDADAARATNQATAVDFLIEAIRASPFELIGAGHRVVHGGLDFVAPVRVTQEVMERLERLAPLAPDHQPHNIAAIRAFTAHWPHLQQVAAFDTAFHRTQPRLAQLFALPRSYADEGILRYGFHGLSYEYIAGVLPDVLGPRADGRVILAHLGHGASLCAMRERRSIATTMGFTPTDGLMMGRRSGSLDPGVIIHLIRDRGMSVADVADLLNNRSGLLGVSGISDDVRVLEQSDDPRAKEALALFAYRAVGEAGAIIAALGGLDALVFTAGIGENSARVRAAICEGLGWIGVSIDPDSNAASSRRINAAGSAVDVLVIPTNEELPIATATRDLLSLA